MWKQHSNNITVRVPQISAGGDAPALVTYKSAAGLKLALATRAVLGGYLQVACEGNCRIPSLQGGFVRGRSSQQRRFRHITAMQRYIPEILGISQCVHERVGGRHGSGGTYTD